MCRITASNGLKLVVTIGLWPRPIAQSTKPSALRPSSVLMRAKSMSLAVLMSVVSIRSQLPATKCGAVCTASPW